MCHRVWGAVCAGSRPPRRRGSGVSETVLLEGVIVMDKRLYEARTGYGAHVHHPPPTAQHEWLSTSAAPYGSHSTLSQESTSLRNTRFNNLVYAASCCLAPTVDMEI